MKVKPTVKLDGCCFEIGYAASVVEETINKVATGRVACVLTSAHDSTHHDDSLHYVGRAIDVRTREMSNSQQQEVLNVCKLKLGPLGFDVVLEKDHLHIEYDPKSGRAFAQIVS